MAQEPRSRSASASAEAVAFVYAKVAELDAAVRERDATIAELQRKLHYHQQQQSKQQETTTTAQQPLQTKEREQALALRALRDHTMTLMALERAAASGGVAGPQLPEQMYARIVELEEQLGAALRRCADHEEELRRAEKTVARLEAERAREGAAYRAAIAAAEEAGAKQAKSQLASLGTQLAAALEENRLQRSVQRAKTRAIEELGVKARDGSEAAVLAVRLRTELGERTKALAELAEENARLMRLADQNAAEIAELRQAAVAGRGVPFSAWTAEREALKAEVRKAKEALAASERNASRILQTQKLKQQQHRRRSLSPTSPPAASALQRHLLLAPSSLSSASAFGSTL